MSSSLGAASLLYCQLQGIPFLRYHHHCEFGQEAFIFEAPQNLSAWSVQTGSASTSQPVHGRLCEAQRSQSDVCLALREAVQTVSCSARFAPLAASKKYTRGLRQNGCLWLFPRAGTQATHTGLEFPGPLIGTTVPCLPECKETFLLFIQPRFPSTQRSVSLSAGIKGTGYQVLF